jgi:hypothetical protein
MGIIPEVKQFPLPDSANLQKPVTAAVVAVEAISYV